MNGECLYCISTVVSNANSLINVPALAYNGDFLSERREWKNMRASESGLVVGMRRNGKCQEWMIKDESGTKESR